MPATPIRKRTTGPLIGAHMSIAGGVFNAILAGEEAGCRTVQLFNKSSNQWAAKTLTDKEVEQFQDEAARTKIAPLVSHTSYLINCGSPNPALWKKSVSALGIEYQRCDTLKIDYLVMHPGAHTGSGTEAGIEKIGKAINRVFGKYPRGKTIICLEATAGAGSIIGGTFEELAAIIELVDDSDRIGVCLDTCHIFAAGYDMRTRSGYRSVLVDFDRIVGLNRMKVWHFNDSKGEFASHKDRHEHIGSGHIGRDAFGFIMRDRRFTRVPKILETPKFKGEREMDPVNLRLLRKLAGTTKKK